MRLKKSLRKFILRNFSQQQASSCAFRCHRLTKLVGFIEQRVLCPKCLSVLYLYEHTRKFSVDPGHTLQSSGSWLSQGCKPEQSSLKGTLILAVIFILQKAFGWSICIKISKSSKIWHLQPWSCMGNSLQPMSTARNMFGEVVPIPSYPKGPLAFFSCF